MIFVVIRELFPVLIGVIMATAMTLKGKTVESRKVPTVYVNKQKVPFVVGDRVRLKSTALSLFRKTEGETFVGHTITQTRIKSLFHDVRGLVRLETRLGGYWTWDVNDLEKVE